ncbi:hypothetical protein K0M31_018611, partial [Melipona bicolor]
ANGELGTQSWRVQQDLESKGTGAELVTVDEEGQRGRCGSHVSFLSTDGFTRAERYEPPSLCPGHTSGAHSVAMDARIMACRQGCRLGQVFNGHVITSSCVLVPRTEWTTRMATALKRHELDSQAAKQTIFVAPAFYRRAGSGRRPVGRRLTVTSSN